MYKYYVLFNQEISNMKRIQMVFQAQWNPLQPGVSDDDYDEKDMLDIEIDMEELTN